MTTLTPQEQLFLERLASYLPNVDTTGIEELRAAGELVLADDRRLVGKLFGNDAFKAEAANHLRRQVFDRLK